MGEFSDVEDDDHGGDVLSDTDEPSTSSKAGGPSKAGALVKASGSYIISSASKTTKRKPEKGAVHRRPKNSKIAATENKIDEAPGNDQQEAEKDKLIKEQDRKLKKQEEKLKEQADELKRLQQMFDLMNKKMGLLSK